MIGLGPTSTALALIDMSCLVLGTWQYKLGGAPGDRVEGYDELGQSIGVVLGTECGQVPGRPEFGARLRQYLGKPVNNIAAPVAQEVIRALTLNEPRVKVSAVRVIGYDAAGKLEIEVDWSATTPLAIGDTRTLTTKVHLG